LFRNWHFADVNQKANTVKAECSVCFSEHFDIFLIDIHQNDSYLKTLLAVWWLYFQENGSNIINFGDHKITVVSNQDSITIWLSFSSIWKYCFYNHPGRKWTNKINLKSHQNIEFKFDFFSDYRDLNTTQCNIKILLIMNLWNK